MHLGCAEVAVVSLMKLFILSSNIHCAKLYYEPEPAPTALPSEAPVESSEASVVKIYGEFSRLRLKYLSMQETYHQCLDKWTVPRLKLGIPLRDNWTLHSCLLHQDSNPGIYKMNRFCKSACISRL